MSSSGVGASASITATRTSRAPTLNLYAAARGERESASTLPRCPCRLSRVSESLSCLAAQGLRPLSRCPKPAPTPSRYHGRFVLRFLDEFRDQITWTQEPKENKRKEEMENRLAQQRREKEAHEALRRQHAAEDEAQSLSQDVGQADGDADVPTSPVRSGSEERRLWEEERRRKDEEEATRLAREHAETERVLEELRRAEEEDLQSQQAAEELRAEEKMRALQQMEAERLQALLDGEEASLRLARELEMDGFTCESCRETFPRGDIFSLHTCGCGDGAQYCIVCMRGWTLSQIMDQVTQPSVWCWSARLYSALTTVHSHDTATDRE
jgi:hypothetical protein